ncbi:MAG: hypothetical protein AB1486_11475 [Planctomycetota bacterium]
MQTRVLILTGHGQDLVGFRDTLRARGLQVELASPTDGEASFPGGGIWQVALVDLRPEPRDALERFQTVLADLAESDCQLVGLASDGACVEGLDPAELGLDAIVLRTSDPDLLVARLALLGIDELRDGEGRAGRLEDRLERALAGPLAVASSVAYVLERHAETLSAAEMASLVGELDLEGSRVRRIIEDVEALESLQDGRARRRFESEHTTVDVVRLARELAQSCRDNEALAASVMVVAPDYPVRVTSHADLLRGLVERLLVAAVEDCAVGPQVVDIRVEPSHERVSLAVLSRQSSTWRPDWRDQSPQLGLRPGRDLTLAVARGYAELHGGTLRLVNGPHHKTCYEVVLPG